MTSDPFPDDGGDAGRIERFVARVGETCERCGKTPATGYAAINDRRYCHGDDDADPTCYELAQHERSFPASRQRRHLPPF